MPAAAWHACRLHSRETDDTGAIEQTLIEDKIEAFNVGNQFRVYDEKIRTPGDGLIIFQVMQDHTAESIKSLEGYRIAWIEEAQGLSQRSLALLRPTIRAAGSEIWASWNPRRKTDAIDEFFRQRRPDNAIIVHSNWRDNPWFTPELEEERQLDLKTLPGALRPHLGARIRQSDSAYLFGGDPV
jgi:phage terminase large subunit